MKHKASNFLKIFILLISVLLIFLVFFVNRVSAFSLFDISRGLFRFLASVFLTTTQDSVEVEILYPGTYQTNSNPGQSLSTSIFLKNKSSEEYVKLTQIVLGNQQNNNFLSYIEENSYLVQYTDSKGVHTFTLTDSGQNSSTGYRIFNISPSLSLPPNSTKQYQVSAKFKDILPLKETIIELTDIYGSGAATGKPIKSQGSLSIKINISQPTPICQTPTYQCSADQTKVLKVCEDGTTSIFQDCTAENKICSQDKCVEKTCSDGTLYKQCSQTKPKYCKDGVLANNCQLCGCPSGQICQTDGNCITEIKTCSDGTLYGQCSSIKPKYCKDGTLIDSCQQCGCLSGKVCQTDGTCQTPVTCTDSDGGKDFYVKGKTTGYPKIRIDQPIGYETGKYSTYGAGDYVILEDYCYKSYDSATGKYGSRVAVEKGEWLREYFCDTDNRITFYAQKCENGCQDGACLKTCTDGTLYGQCSSTKPKYCKDGTLINSCQQCGCLSGQVCQTDGTCQTPVICSNCDIRHYCEEDACKLKEFNYNLGLIYVYSEEDNYNPNWRTEFQEIVRKVKESVSQVTEGRVNVLFDIIGESKIDTFCWNPAKPRVNCDGTYFPLPGSSFTAVSSEMACESIDIIECDKCKVERVTIKLTSEGDKICSEGVEDWETLPGQCNYNFKPFFCDGSTGELVLDCTKCGCDEGNYCDEISGKCKATGSENLKDYRVSIDCENSLSPNYLWANQGTLRKELEEKMNFKFDNYEGVFIIFGRLGIPLMDEPHFYDYKCKVSDSIIGGYSNLIMGEDFIKSGGLVDCDANNYYGKFYYKMGWHSMTHEILHIVGAVDVYHTGTAFGIISEREKALKIDSRTDESIMGNDEKLCMSDFSCTIAELDTVYLDKYNRFNIGLNIDTTGMTPEVIELLKSRNKCEQFPCSFEEKVPSAKAPTEKPPEIEAKMKELKQKIAEIQQKIIQLLAQLIELLKQKL